MASYPVTPRALALAAILALAAACGGSDSTDPGSNDGNNGSTNGGNNDPAACAVTLSGAQTGSFGCTDLALIYTANDGNSGFGFKAVGGADTVTVAVNFHGKPAATAYDDAAGANAELLILNGTTLWTGGSPAGSWTLTISSVDIINSVADFTKYQVHGSLAATLQPASGTDPTPVTLNATF